MSKSKKRWEMPKQCDQWQCWNTTKRSEPPAQATNDNQQCNYLPCGGRQPLNAAVDPPNPPSWIFWMLRKLSKLKSEWFAGSVGSKKWKKFLALNMVHVSRKSGISEAIHKKCQYDKSVCPLPGQQCHVEWILRTDGRNRKWTDWIWLTRTFWDQVGPLDN